MRKTRTSNAFYQMGLTTLLASLLWASTSIYSALVSPADVEVDSKTLSPIQPSLDIDLMQEISNRDQLWKNVDSILEGQVVENSPSPTPPPSPSVAPSPSASPSGETTGATESGVLEQ